MFKITIVCFRLVKAEVYARLDLLKLHGALFCHIALRLRDSITHSPLDGRSVGRGIYVKARG